MVVGCPATVKPFNRRWNRLSSLSKTQIEWQDSTTTESLIQPHFPDAEMICGMVFLRRNYPDQVMEVAGVL